MIQTIKALIQGRSSRWPSVRKAHLKLEPACRACGGTSKLEVHHIAAFSDRPDLELDPSNLVTLCESPTHNCHLIWGHFLNWRLINPDVVTDSAAYRGKLAAARAAG